ncbi:MAG: amidohydrolase [Bacillota bacterium]|jgi:5-methylthioadenosine/S-adenosylhomocysteine deaminase
MLTKIDNVWVITPRASQPQGTTPDSQATNAVDVFYGCVIIEDDTIVYAGKPEEWNGCTDCEAARGSADRNADHSVGRSADRSIADRTTGKPQCECEFDALVDGKGKILIPGLMNCHTHVPMVMLRGLADDLELHTWLQQAVFPIENGMTPEDVYWATKVGIAEMIRGGTTCFADMYFHMDSLAQAVAEAGIRAVLSWGFGNVGGNGEAKLANSLDFALRHRNGADGRITTMLGPHAPYTCSPDFLKEVAALAREYEFPIHIHVSETAHEVSQIKEQYGKTPVELLEEVGLFGTRMLAAHGVHLSDRDMEILAAHGASVAHCPASNLKLASGIAAVDRMAAKGVNVCLGTDGAASNNTLDMISEMRLAALLAKGSTGNPTALPAAAAINSVMANGAKALALEGVVGAISPGMKADLALIDYQKPHLTPDMNLVSLLVYSSRADDVSDVMVDGQWLMRDRVLLTIDEYEAMWHCKNSIRRIKESL